MTYRCDKITTKRRNCPVHGRMVRNGSLRRKSDSKVLQRWRCAKCGKTTSEATGTACFGQNKRRINALVRDLLASSTSQRRIAKILHVDRKTIARKLDFLAKEARASQQKRLTEMAPFSIQKIQFDEMETFEHSMMKPLSIAVIVNPENRQILAAQVASMPARGHLASRSRTKYGKRPDERKTAMVSSLKKISPFVAKKAVFTSDKKSAYPGWLKRVNPCWRHIRVKGRKPASVGMGELKEGHYDPLFYLNHTAAMIRDGVKRLTRKTWCTTKIASKLQNNLDIYTDYHNSELVPLSSA